MKTCRFHTPELRESAIAEHTARLRAYHERLRVAKALAESARKAA
jgi:hypothetical protein